MQYDTRALGRLEITADKQFHFPEGLFAFEHLKHYALLPTKAESTFHWLQSLEEARLAFLVAPMNAISATYQPAIFPSDMGDDWSLTKVEVWGIVTVPPGKPEQMTVNLQGPLLMNRKLKKGYQVVSDHPDHLVRVLVMDLVEKTGK